MMIIGIDVGLSGAIAVLHDYTSAVVGVWDTPILTIKKNKGVRHEIDRPALAELMREILRQRDELGEPVACIEAVHSMPGQGVASSFEFGKGYGQFLMLMTVLKIPVDLVSPQRWKKTMMADMGKDKDASRIRAKELFGSQIDLSLKKHHGRADAILIAEYRRRLG